MLLSAPTLQETPRLIRRYALQNKAVRECLGATQARPSDKIIFKKDVTGCDQDCLAAKPFAVWKLSALVMSC